MRSRVLLIVSIVELVIIAVLATVFFLPKEKQKLSEMRYEKQVEFLKESGVEEEDHYLQFAIRCISECEANPYFVPTAYSNPQIYRIAEKVRKAVNEYYGIQAPDVVFHTFE